MQDEKRTRRAMGMLKARLPELKLELVKDPRGKGMQWPLTAMLTGFLSGLLAGCKSFNEVETLTAEMSPATLRRLGIKGRIPDTTQRELAVELPIEDMRGILRRSAKAAYRRKALESSFPFDVVAMDGKATMVQELDNCWAQTQHKKKGLAAHGLVRTITCTLVTALTRPILEVVPMGAKGNEVGFFATAFQELRKHHAAAFDLVTYDAGANSARNAKLVTDAGKHFVFAIKDENRFLLRRVKEVLGHKPPQTAVKSTEDVLSKRDNVRILRHLHVAEVPNGYKSMRSVRTALRVHTQKVNGRGEVLSEENRFFISSLVHTRMSHLQWLELIRMHWGVETSHCILDVSFEEDERPYVTHSAQGMLVMMVLRRVAYNLLALWKGRTLKSDDHRLAPWKEAFRWVRSALEQATWAAFDGLRLRKVSPAFS